MQFAHGTDAAMFQTPSFDQTPTLPLALSTYVDIDVIHVMKWTRPFPSDFAYGIKANL